MRSEPSHLAYASARAARRAGFLAATFAAYREVERVSDEELRALLGCTEGDYHRLALCKAVASPTGDDVRRLAEFAGADLGALARVLRRVEAVGALRQAADTATRSVLLAAREREAPPGDDDDPSR
jgi:predicted transcriptional regulator